MVSKEFYLFNNIIRKDEYRNVCNDLISIITEKNKNHCFNRKKNICTLTEIIID